jgi:hypothetical protein
MNEKCGKKRIKKPKPDTYQNLSVIDMRKQLKGLVKNVYKLNRQDLCQELYKQEQVSQKNYKLIPKRERESISELGFLNYDGSNSCYIDTSIMSLFHTPNNILKELIVLYNDLHKNSNKNAKCSRLRSLFSSFDNQYKKRNKGMDNIDWINSQQEPRDVINMLLKIFDIKRTIKVRVTTKSLVRIEDRWFNDPIINFDVLMSKRIIYLKNYFPITTEIYTLENNERFKKINEIMDANFLFININRNFMNETKVITPVIPEEYLTLSNKKQLLCTSILIHHGSTTYSGHYTCAFRYFKDGKWWYFDDMMNKYKLIGSFSDVLEWNNGYIKKNMVSIVYLNL